MERFASYMTNDLSPCHVGVRLWDLKKEWIPELEDYTNWGFGRPAMTLLLLHIFAYQILYES